MKKSATAFCPCQSVILNINASQMTTEKKILTETLELTRASFVLRRRRNVGQLYKCKENGHPSEGNRRPPSIYP